MDENHRDKTGSKPRVAYRKKPTGFEDKTLWDLLDLSSKLAIPLVVLVATIGFGLLQLHLADVQHQQDQASASLQHQRDQAITLDQQRAAILQTYIDNIQDLMLNHHLLDADPYDPSNQYRDIASLARARTLTALQGLDPERKARLLVFLYEAKLIGYFDDTTHQTVNSIIDLIAADLSGADLSGVSPFIVNLSGVDFVGVTLNGANLYYVNLYKANLRAAFLNGTDLSGTDLSGADLSGAHNLTQKQLDQVSTCKGATLPKGLTCHHNQ